jgi:16S rRNA (cytidine1402-2'-O)-methyltransferase
MSGRLFLVATPIGNLGDVTLRALEVLSNVKIIACEDTRRTRVLLEAHRIGTPTTSLPAFAEGERAGALIARLVAGDDVAVVTDAGSPGISDPGERLVVEAVEAGVDVIPVPGPAALVAALTASGLPTGRFHFLGFLPRQTSDARQMLEEIVPLSASVILYESPRRLFETLELLTKVLGDRRACVGRELTKVHEELVRGRLSALVERYRGAEVLGEVVVVVEGRTGPTRWEEAEVMAALDAGLRGGERLKAVAADVAGRAGWTSQAVYRLGLKVQGR